ncbi:MAG TPA: exodeoxyribonuclease V subunit alpha [Xanthomonadaceae bacterium]|jgi:exodeoxyribonuclease V alpha subunit|nr:exodeoxyribonuclease V subunit alpha [Xanthomonadaceae bacterium]
MNGYAFRRDPLESAEEAWRPLDRALLRWVRAHGGSEPLARLAAWASLVDSLGDTALSLREATNRHGAPVLAETDIAALREEPLVGRGEDDADTPFVLDVDDRFYLRRNHRHETAVARAIHRLRVDARTEVIDDADLDALFHGRRDEAIAPQREAVRRVAGRRLFVLTGGPGTGKTTTVLRMLLMLQSRRRHRSEPALTIRLAAPTGKAAQRLTQALQGGLRELLADRDAGGRPQAPLPSDWHPLLAGLADAQALTLHRLLGYEPHRSRFRHDARHPLAADIVVVDEASMVDLALLHALLDALRPDASLILVGDADQLASVAAGSAFMDLVVAMEAEQVGDLVRLRHGFRTGDELAAICESVREGDAAQFDVAIAAAGTHARRIAIAGRDGLVRELRRWADGIASLESLRQRLPVSMNADEAAVSAVVSSALAALGQRQLLCALREGAFGAQAANELIELRLRRAWKIPDAATWYAGRAVVVTRNDYATRLFNGDVGLCLTDADGRLRAWFAGVDEAGRPGVRSFDPHALPMHEGAFAITIHKSQGSEYDQVAVLLPPEADHRILSRQLLYTGLSRAKHRVELWGTDVLFKAALAQPVHRMGGLVERLRIGTLQR